jgi:hypothetical protein
LITANQAVDINTRYSRAYPRSDGSSIRFCGRRCTRRRDGVDDEGLVAAMEAAIARTQRV